jgi:hypothetical protein
MKLELNNAKYKILTSTTDVAFATHVAGARAVDVAFATHVAGARAVGVAFATQVAGVRAVGVAFATLVAGRAPHVLHLQHI